MTTFQEYLNQFESAVLQMAKLAMSAGNMIRKTKREAFAAAVALKGMVDARDGSVIQTCRDAGLTGKDAVDRWLKKKFAPYALVGEDYHELIGAVNDGMTLAQYLAKSAGSFRVETKRTVRALLVKAPTPAEPSEKMTIGERLKRWKAIAESERAKRMDLEAKVRDLSAELKTEVKRISSGLRRLSA